MEEMDTLGKALASVRDRKAALELELQRIGTEFANLERAERSLAVVVEGQPDTEYSGSVTRKEVNAPTSNIKGRGSRGPRTNSARHRLKRLLSDASETGLTHAEIVREMHDVSPNTLAAYLSTLVTSGQATRNGDRYLITQTSVEQASADEDLQAQ